MYKKLQTFSKLRVIPPHALTKEATVNAYSSIAACESCVLVRSTFWCPTETSGFTIQRSISMLAKPAQRRFPREILRSSVLGALLLSCLYSDLTMSLDARPDFFCAMVEVVIQTTFGPEYARRVRVDCANWRFMVMPAIRSKPTARCTDLPINHSFPRIACCSHGRNKHRRIVALDAR